MEIDSKGQVSKDMATLRELVANYRGVNTDECQICGAKGIVNVHHILPREEGGKSILENLALLCSVCHGKIHRVRKSWSRETNEFLNKYEGKFIKHRKR